MEKEWIKQFCEDVEDRNGSHKELNMEKALIDLFERELILVEQQTRFEDRLKRLEEIQLRVLKNLERIMENK